MKALYKYPQAEFPYRELVDGNRHRSRLESEYELLDTGVFDQSRYFDCWIEYAKASPNDILIRATLVNRGPEPAAVHVLPQWWFRNSWTWHSTAEESVVRPRLWLDTDRIVAEHQTLGRWIIQSAVASDGVRPGYLFTENETNPHRHPGVRATVDRYFKDGINNFVVHGDERAINPDQQGTKVAAHTQHMLAAGGELTITARMAYQDEQPADWFGTDFQAVWQQRQREADEFYAAKIPASLGEDERRVSRQAYAGLLWTKQYYHYVVSDWLDGSAGEEPGHASRQSGRNRDWRHLFNRDIISMPDKWEYPWYAAWDLAFHMIPMAQIDMEFAKQQMILFLREWYCIPTARCRPWIGG